MDHSLSVYHEGVISVHAAPHVHLDFIPRAKHIIVGHRDLRNRAEGACGPCEKLVPENLQSPLFDLSRLIDPFRLREVFFWWGFHLSPSCLALGNRSRTPSLAKELPACRDLFPSQSAGIGEWLPRRRIQALTANGRGLPLLHLLFGRTLRDFALLKHAQ